MNLALGMLGKAHQDPEHLAMAHPFWQIFYIIIIKYNWGKIKCLQANSHQVNICPIFHVRNKVQSNQGK